MHILLNRGAMFDIATHMSRSMSILLRYFRFITPTAEKPALHKYDVAKGTRTRRALQPTSGNSDRALTQNEMSKLRLYMHKLFKVRSKERSIKLFSFQRCKPLRGICIINKRISYPIVLLHVFRKIFLKMRD